MEEGRRGRRNDKERSDCGRAQRRAVLAARDRRRCDSGVCVVQRPNHHYHPGRGRQRGDATRGGATAGHAAMMAARPAVRAARSRGFRGARMTMMTVVRRRRHVMMGLRRVRVRRQWAGGQRCRAEHAQQEPQRGKCATSMQPMAQRTDHLKSLLRL